MTAGIEIRPKAVDMAYAPSHLVEMHVRPLLGERDHQIVVCQHLVPDRANRTPDRLEGGRHLSLTKRAKAGIARHHPGLFTVMEAFS